MVVVTGAGPVSSRRIFLFGATVARVSGEGLVAGFFGIVGTQKSRGTNRVRGGGGDGSVDGVGHDGRDGGGGCGRRLMEGADVMARQGLVSGIHGRIRVVVLGAAVVAAGIRQGARLVACCVAGSCLTERGPGSQSGGGARNKVARSRGLRG